MILKCVCMCICILMVNKSAVEVIIHGIIMTLYNIITKFAVYLCN